MQATDGNLYGTTSAGGISGNSGTVFNMTLTNGFTLTPLISFNGNDGAYPYTGLVQATDGNFYGTTYNGGASGNCQNGCGTVFKITRAGTLTTLHSFNGTDGSQPYGPLVQASDGNFYGTTYGGGASGNCQNGCGTFFKITPYGTLTTLHSFSGTDGAHPSGALVQGTDASFYGTTSGGGSSSNCQNGCGTVFEISQQNMQITLITLHNFTGYDGAYPYGGLMQATDGNFYGTTYQEGAFCCGTVFRLSTGLGPFVETEPSSGIVIERRSLS